MNAIPAITRTHLTALMVKDGMTHLILVDGHLRVGDLGTLIATGGRLVCNRQDLLDAGVRVSRTNRSRLAAGSGPIVDRLARELIELLHDAVNEEARRG